MSSASTKKADADKAKGRYESAVRRTPNRGFQKDLSSWKYGRFVRFVSYCIRFKIDVFSTAVGEEERKRYEKSLLLYCPDQAYCASQAGQADACVRVPYDVIPIVNWVFLLFVLSFLVVSLLDPVVRLSFHRNSVTARQNSME